MIGQAVSHFTILEKLGHGGMGVVYKARDDNLDRFVALKFLPAHLSEDPTQKARLVREAKAASAIDHPNVGAVYEIGESRDGRLFIAMAYYEGENLKQKIESGRIPVSQAIDLCRQIAQGLHRAHSVGVVHRDLKPHNIIITPEGVAKIIDFGLARLARNDLSLTKPGTTIGTISYISPEQARGEDVDQRTDIWGLGVILYEMLTVTLPFRGEYEPAVVYSILNEEPVPVRTLAPDVPPEIAHVVQKALAKKAEDRYRDALEMERDLAPPGGPKQADYPLQPIAPRFRSMLRTGALYAAGAAVIAMGALFLTHRLAPRAPLMESIAVLPFSTEEAGAEYLSSGITENIITNLGALSSLRVISHRAVSRFNSSTSDPGKAGRVLHVQAVLAGRVRRNGSNLVMKITLVETETGQEVWSAEYHKPAAMLASLLSDAVLEIVQRSRIPITDEERRRLAKSPTVNPAAFELCLKGLWYLDKYQPADNALAISFLQQSIEHDSLFGLGYAMLAEAQVSNVEWEWDTDAKWLAAAEHNGRQAISIDSGLVWAYPALARVKFRHNEHNQGRALLEQAIRLNPNFVVPYNVLGKEYLFVEHDPARALTYLLRAQEIDPANFVNVMNVGIGHAMLRNYTESIRSLRLAAQLDTIHEVPWMNLGVAFEHLGFYDSAAAAYRHATGLNPAYAPAYENLGTIYLGQGKTGAAKAILDRGLRSCTPKYRLLYLTGIADNTEGSRSLAQMHWVQGLKIVESLERASGVEAEVLSFGGLFSARLGRIREAIECGQKAVASDSSDSETALAMARINAVLKNKSEMLRWFAAAKRLDPDIDESELATVADLLPYRQDPDMLAIARRQ